MSKEKKAVDCQQERWRVVLGHPWYEVSDLGRVRAIEKTVEVVRDGKPYSRLQAAKFLTPLKVCEVRLYHKNKPPVRVFIPRLVALAFIGPPPKGKPYVLHGDDDRANNAVGNLRWGSHQENMDDRSERNRQAKGSKMPQAVLNGTKVRQIRAALKRGLRHQDIADSFLISKSTVGQISRGTTWKHI